MANFSIKDLSEFSGLKQHTIRVWEQRYSFLQPQRSASAHRMYTPKELGVLMDAALLNKNGYKVSMIDKMSFEKKLQIFSNVVDKQQKVVHELVIHMAMMDVFAFEAALNHAVETWGIHAAIQQVILPFCEKVGLLHGTYNKNYIENIIMIRQTLVNKLVSGIEKASPAIQLKRKVLIFLTGTQVQELPLLQLQYKLIMHGFTTIHLGRVINTSHLHQICSKIKADYIITHVGKEGNGSKHLEGFVENLQRGEDNTEFYSIGYTLGTAKEQRRYKSVPDTAHALQLLLEKESLHLLS